MRSPPPNNNKRVVILVPLAFDTWGRDHFDWLWDMRRGRGAGRGGSGLRTGGDAVAFTGRGVKALVLVSFLDIVFGRASTSSCYRPEGKFDRGLGMRRLCLVAVSLALIVVSLPPLPAQASHETLTCTAVLDLAITPGLSIMPSKGTFTTGKNPGPMECAGMLQGHEVAGLGSLGITGNYGESSNAGDTCHLVLGTGTYLLRLPTRHGPVTEEGTFAEVLAPTRRGSVSAASEQTNWTGTAEFVPTEGDCLFKPITAAQIKLRLEGRHAGSSGSDVEGLAAFEPSPGIDSGQETGRVGPRPLSRLLPLSHLVVDLGNIAGD